MRFWRFSIRSRCASSRTSALLSEGWALKSNVSRLLTAETRGLIGAETFAAAKRGMILINTARGPVVDIDALYDAMKDGTVLAAGLDVLPEEPANSQRRLIAAWQKNEDWIRHRLLLHRIRPFIHPRACGITGPSRPAPRRAFCATDGWRTASTSNSWCRKPEGAEGTKGGATVGPAGRRDGLTPGRDPANIHWPSSTIRCGCTGWRGRA